jgi:hypothetical protein
VEDTTIVASSTAGMDAHTHNGQVARNIADKFIVDKENRQSSLANQTRGNRGRGVEKWADSHPALLSIDTVDGETILRAHLLLPPMFLLPLGTRSLEMSPTANHRLPHFLLQPSPQCADR